MVSYRQRRWERDAAERRARENARSPQPLQTPQPLMGYCGACHCFAELATCAGCRRDVCDRCLRASIPASDRARCVACGLDERRRLARQGISPQESDVIISGATRVAQRIHAATIEAVRLAEVELQERLGSTQALRRVARVEQHAVPFYGMELRFDGAPIWRCGWSEDGTPEAPAWRLTSRWLVDVASLRTS